MDRYPLSDHAFERSRQTAWAVSLVLAGAATFLLLGWWAKGCRPGGHAFVYAGTALAALFLALLLRLRPRPGVFVALAVLEQTFCVLLTWFDLGRSVDYLAYTIGIFALGVVYSTGPLGYAVVLGGGFAGLMVLVGSTVPWRLAQTDYWTLTASLGVAYAGCLLLERQRRRSDELARRLEGANRELQELSSRDPLTGLHNRRSLVEALSSQRALALRMGMPLSVVLLDLDLFKKINDTLGHLVGDEVLKGVALGLQRGLRQSDLAARYGGEEFVLLLPQADAQNALRVTERILGELRRTAFAGVPWTVTFSAGVAQLTAEESVESLLGRADQKLYEAKAERNRVVS